MCRLPSDGLVLEGDHGGHSRHVGNGVLGVPPEEEFVGVARRHRTLNPHLQTPLPSPSRHHLRLSLLSLLSSQKFAGTLQARNLSVTYFGTPKITPTSICGSQQLGDARFETQTLGQEFAPSLVTQNSTPCTGSVYPR